MKASVLPPLPDSPGVYLFRDAAGRVLYVGKAKSLRARVRSYFSGTPASPRIGKMTRMAARVECVVTDSEVEALGLENNFIKEHRPPYNVLLRDDKTYPYIQLTTGEAFPEARLVRRVESGDGHAYFGPYVPPASPRTLLRFLHTWFKIRQCRGDISRKRARACLYYQLHQCDGPCSKLISKRAYRRQIEDAALFLRGRHKELSARLLADMNAASEATEYEKAARLRDLLRSLEASAPRVQKAATATEKEADVFGVARKDGRAALHVFVIRDGDIIHHRRFAWKDDSAADDASLLGTLLARYYGRTDFVPREIILPQTPSDAAALAEWLRAKRGRRVLLTAPERGDKLALLRLAERNAHLALADPRATLSLDDANPWRVLGLEAEPARVDGFDVSHIRGAETVASLVVWRPSPSGGRPDKKEYRRYRIRDAAPGDDYAAMREAVRRRFRRAIEEGTEIPDLVMVDGGAGQVAAVQEALAEFHLEHLPLVGLAKKEEILYRHNAPPLRLPRSSPVLKTLQRLRDEAHRFALAYHRLRRSKRTFTTALAEIPGVGEKRAALLLRKFGSLRGAAEADEAALAPMLGKRLARRVKTALARTESGEPDERG